MTTAALAWKEYREVRPIWVAMALLSVALVYGVGTLFYADANPDTATTLVVLAIALNATFGLVCGAGLLAGEREGGTEPFLDALTCRRSTLWRAKVLVGGYFVLAQSLVAAGLVYHLGLGLGWAHEGTTPLSLLHWFWIMPAIAVEAYCWGLLFSAFSESGLRAAAVAALPVVNLWCFTGSVSSSSWTWLLVVHGLPTVLALGFSRVVYSRADGERRVAGALAERSRLRRASGASDLEERLVVPERRPRTRGVADLIGLCWRQGRLLLVGLLVAVVVCNLLIVGFGLLVWLPYALLVGLACGYRAFGLESLSGATYLADARLPPGRVWCAKVGFWLGITYLAAIAGVLGLFAANLLPRLFGFDRADVLGEGQGVFFFDAQLLIASGFVPTILLWPTLGFAVGHFASLLARRPILGVVAALAVGTLVGLLWLPSTLLGGLRTWQVVLPSVVLLVAGRVALWDWACGRLATRVPAVRLALGGIAAVLSLVAGLAYRVAEVPDVAPPFDVAAHVATLRTAEANESANRLRVALRGMETARQEAAQRVGRLPRPPQDDGRVLEPPADNIPLVGVQNEWLAHVAEHGWRQAPPQFQEWLDRVFAAPWHTELTEAVRLPLGVFDNPAPMTVSSLLPALQPMREIAQLLDARAMQLLARGDAVGALDRIVATLALSRQVMHQTPLMHRLVGTAIEQVALKSLDRWLAAVHPAPLLRRARDEVQRHLASRPPMEGMLRAEYLILRNSVDQPASLLLFEIGLDVREPSGQLREDLLGLAAQVPWERTRRERLVNTLFAGMFRELAAWSGPVAPSLSQRREADLRAGALARLGWRAADKGVEANLVPERFWELLISSHLRLLLFHGRDPNFLETRLVCKLRAAMLSLAVREYTTDQGAPPTRLEDLVPRYLVELPADPFTGKAFGYRVIPREPWRAVARAVLDQLPLPWRLGEGGEEIPLGAADDYNKPLRLTPGQPVLWSAGPDGVDHGGRQAWSERRLIESDPAANGKRDYVFPVPQPEP